MPQLIKAFPGSGVSQVEFCRRHAVPLGTFRWYLKQQRDELAGKGYGGLVAVEVARPMQQESERALAVVLPQGRRIEVGIGFDASTLAQIVTVLERM